MGSLGSYDPLKNLDCDLNEFVVTITLPSDLVMKDSFLSASELLSGHPLRLVLGIISWLILSLVATKARPTAYGARDVACSSANEATDEAPDAGSDACACGASYYSAAYSSDPVARMECVPGASACIPGEVVTRPGALIPAEVQAVPSTRKLRLLWLRRGVGQSRCRTVRVSARPVYILQLE